ncbi:glycosyltransferase involved in cell wall biosynthesis [Palleronia aestuarii]|uniref:Glycosyltransferase involved in cell wall biosynthesis n=1 Tax=Palleronia aestuarii TaxID=568105 RepID=A0A2W7NQ92_9RHOB|nr:glycosyltransferase family 4 protein [Palleronia aestuarii]PZX13452.1 glycosyltransferase involved in cell wall biosynthesis [Palleronia aestuarii]
MSGSAISGPIAYLTGEYPRATDTFIQREVAALRALGIEVLTHSVRATDASHHVGPEQRAEHAATFRVQPAAKRPATLLRSHLSCLGRRWLAAARLAWRTRPAGLKGSLWQIFYFLEAGVLAARLKEKGVVHLHNHFGNSSCSVAMLASEMSGVPFSYTMHGPMEFFEPQTWRIDAKVARAAFVACISHYARAQGMIFADQSHWERMRIVHCGVDPALYDGAERSGPGKTILFVGRLAAIKGVALLLDAVAALAPDHPDLRLTLVGDGPDRAGLEARARDLGIAEAVTFTGYLGQAEVAEHLARADIFALPSFAEGVPVVLMEAMAARLPVVAPRVAGVPELVADGEAGFVVPPGDPETLKVRLDTLLSDADLRARMGEAGRARVAAEYDAKAEAAWLARLIAGSLEGRLPDGLRPEAEVPA